MGEPVETIVAVTAAMRGLVDAADRLARRDVPVLITGETGTGKDLFARRIHVRSARQAGAFVPVNCGAIPSALVASELFGHARGAFTGAGTSAPGLFESADGGVLFLDEVGRLPMAAQVALLRVVETGMVRRVGATREQRVDVRVLGATNEPIDPASGAGSFRADLYYRLAVETIHLPPLRERLGDLPALVDHMIGQEGEQGRRVEGITAEALEVLSRHAWPGNIRELRNVIGQAISRAKGAVICAEDLPEGLRGKRVKNGVRLAVQQTERSVIEEALERTNGNMAEAARVSQVPLATLYRKVAKHRIDTGKFRKLRSSQD